MGGHVVGGETEREGLVSEPDSRLVRPVRRGRVGDLATGQDQPALHAVRAQPHDEPDAGAAAEVEGVRLAEAGMRSVDVEVVTGPREPGQRRPRIVLRKVVHQRDARRLHGEEGQISEPESNSA